ncbi:MAG: type I-U CRISPR-associated protein Cas8c [Bryobacterales bacterium]|nr:type I-U CRISPR-associated protein Cas8c [Bryobacterales bacterium]
MAKSSIPVDLLNPGQVFACLGILEVADMLLADPTASFDWTDGWPTRFHIATADDVGPVQRVLRFLEEAQVVTRAPAQSRNVQRWKASWGAVPAVDRPGSPFPFPDPDSPATLPVVLRDDDDNEVALDYWGDATRRDNVKFWAGAAGYPGAAIVSNALEIVRGKTSQYARDPFALSGPQSSSFRFDWRRDYIPVQDGFSPNRHGKSIQMVGFPLVEILAAIGVTNARPSRMTKLKYRYGVLGVGRGDLLLDPIFHRIALGGESAPVPGRPFRRFLMNLDWPGQEDQARCITEVDEEE